MKHDLLHIQGKPYVLVPLHEYRVMTGGENAEQTGEKGLPGDILDTLAARQDTPLRILRKDRGLTQQELADAVGLSRPYLTEMEKGRKPGSVKTLRALANALSVDTRHLLAG